MFSLCDGYNKTIRVDLKIRCVTRNAFNLFDNCFEFTGYEHKMILIYFMSIHYLNFRDLIELIMKFN